MDKKTRTLLQHFPDANDETKLALLGPSQRLVFGKTPLQLQQYPVGDDEVIYAAYSEDTNTIYIRFL